MPFLQNICVPIDEQTVDWIKQALEGSHKDKVDFHRQAIDALQKRYNKLQTMVDTAYDDKLAGDITVEFWERKSAEWNREMSKIQAKLTDIKSQYGLCENGHPDFRTC